MKKLLKLALKPLAISLFCSATLIACKDNTVEKVDEAKDAVTEDFKTAFDSAKIKAEKSLDSVKKSVDAGLFILKEANKELDKSAKMGMDIDKQAKELGISLPKEYIKATEELRAMYKKIVDLNKTFTSIKF